MQTGDVPTNAACSFNFFFASLKNHTHIKKKIYTQHPIHDRLYSVFQHCFTIHLLSVSHSLFIAVPEKVVHLSNIHQCVSHSQGDCIFDLFLITGYIIRNALKLLLVLPYERTHQHFILSGFGAETVRFVLEYSECKHIGSLPFRISNRVHMSDHGSACEASALLSTVNIT